MYGLCLVYRRSRKENHRDGKQYRDCQGDRLLRHILQRAETSVIHLLLPADVIQFHDFYGKRVIEIRNMRVIEGDMPVFTDSQKAYVDGVFPQKFRIVPANALYIIPAFADIVYISEILQNS